MLPPGSPAAASGSPGAGAVLAPGGDPLREQLSALRSLLVLSMLLTRQDDEARILHLVANAVQSLGHCVTERILLDGRWTEVRLPHHELTGPDLTATILPLEGAPFRLRDVPWAWAYSLSSPGGPAGFLVVGADQEPAETERFLLQVLTQQAGVALANARLHTRERDQAEQLRTSNLALRRTMEIHDRLTQVALTGEGQEGIAQAVYDLTGYPAAIEDRFGNLRAWAGPGCPDPYPKDPPEHRDSLLRRAMKAAAPVRDGERLVSVAMLGGNPQGVLVLHDPDETAVEAERVAIEHATTVLSMELARLQTVAEAETRLRSNLVIELIEGTGGPQALNRAQALGYDLGRPHRVVVIEGGRSHEDLDALFRAVRRGAREVRVGSLLAARLRDVVVLADTKEAPWARFWAVVAGELRGTDCRIGVGGTCARPSELPRSLREARLALRLQQTLLPAGSICEYPKLGIFRMLAAIPDLTEVNGFVRDWLGSLLDYDERRGAELVHTLTQYLEHGGNYDATAAGLSVHRSTLKYRLQRIRELSGLDLNDPDVHFNLQLATRAWGTLQALRSER